MSLSSADGVQVILAVVSVTSVAFTVGAAGAVVSLEIFLPIKRTSAAVATSSPVATPLDSTATNLIYFACTAVENLTVLTLSSKVHVPSADVFHFCPSALVWISYFVIVPFKPPSPMFLRGVYTYPLTS